MVDIYRAGFQLTKVKAWMVLTLLLAAGALYWAWDLFTTYGLRPADGGVLAPLWQRLAWALFVGGFGLALVAGMWAFGRRYVARIRYDEAKDALHIHTLEFLASRASVYSPSDVLWSDYNEGRFEGVNAPWFTMAIKGRTPLVLDAQGVFPDRELAEKLLKIGLKRRR